MVRRPAVRGQLKISVRMNWAAGRAFGNLDRSVALMDEPEADEEIARVRTRLASLETERAELKGSSINE
jgi:hypothetical protein